MTDLEALDQEMDEYSMRLALRETRSIYTACRHKLVWMEGFAEHRPNDEALQETIRALRRYRSTAGALVEWYETAMRDRGYRVPNPRWSRDG